VDLTVLPGVGHAPHREAPDAALKAVAEFANRILKVHGEGELRRAA
jgi:pimeloyl-ACP methyl ester carboxylesterase